MTTWQIEIASYGSEFIKGLLKNGWEPFAATVTGSGCNPSDWTILLRKVVRK